MAAGTRTSGRSTSRRIPTLPTRSERLANSTTMNQPLLPPPPRPWFWRLTFVTYGSFARSSPTNDAAGGTLVTVCRRRNQSQYSPCAWTPVQFPDGAGYART